MDRKLFLSYIQNMQQNNQDMVGFQNSMRKNSWQKPKSLYEMNGGGHVNQPAFDARDREREMYRKAGSEALARIDFDDLAAQAHKDYLESGGTGDIKDVIATVDPSLYIPFREIPDHAHDDAHEAFKEALHGLLKEQTEEDAMIDQYEADREGEISDDERLANIRHRESMGTEPSHPETVMDAARALVAAYDAFKLEQEKIKAAPPGPAWPDNRPEHFKKSK